MRYLTKDWYIACQTDPMTPEVQKRLDEIDRAYCAAQTREALPDGLLRRFFLFSFYIIFLSLSSCCLFLSCNSTVILLFLSSASFSLLRAPTRPRVI